jgi:hypothetical protein
MTVPVTDFVQRMELHWTRVLKNVSSDSFAKVWGQLGNTFNAAIAVSRSGKDSHWFVVRPETGTGKTQGLCLYAAMLPMQGHPGVLIVVRLRKAADRLAETINELAGSNVAAAHHGQNRLQSSVAKTTPVLIITHEAFRRGLVSVEKGDDCWNWDLFTNWRDGRRQLTVIDEELDLLQEASLTLSDVLKAKAIVHTILPHQFPVHFELLDLLEKQLRQIDPDAADGLSERMLWEHWSDLPPCEMLPVCDALRNASPSSSITQAEIEDACETLMHAEHTVRSWCWMSRQAAGGGKAAIRFNGGKLIASRIEGGVVVMDATADLDVSYQLLGNRVQVLPRPANARRYENVTLYQSWGNRTGKHSRTKTKEEDIPMLIGDLNQRLDEGSKVLVVTHKGIEPAFAAHETKFTLTVVHWGAVDGENAWKDYDAVVLFTLPHRPTEWAVNMFFSARGPQTTEWLRDGSSRRFGDHEDVRKALEMGRVAADVVQAVNRVRCRHVINERGDCAPTKVFLYMPSYGGKHLQDKLLSSLPGVQLENWKVGAKATRSVPSKWSAWLVEQVRSWTAGTCLRRTELRDLAGSISEDALDRLIKRLKDPDSDLRQALAAMGVTYTSKKVGKRLVNVLLKA